MKTNSSTFLLDFIHWWVGVGELNLRQLDWILWNLPDCLGATNGKHVNMKCPNNSGSLYYNYKRFFSLVLMAICDSHYNFTLVDIGDYGSNNYSGVLSHFRYGKSHWRGLNKFPQTWTLWRVLCFPFTLLFGWRWGLLLKAVAWTSLSWEVIDRMQADILLQVIQGKEGNKEYLWYFKSKVEVQFLHLLTL